MTKLLDSTGDIFVEGDSIREVLNELNSNSEWYYVYRPDDYRVDAYYAPNEKEADNDVRGKKADKIYDVVTMKYANITTMKQFEDFLYTVDHADFWSVLEPEEYKSACDFAGLNYSDYKDPDSLFTDLWKFKKENEMEKGGEER